MSADAAAKGVAFAVDDDELSLESDNALISGLLAISSVPPGPEEKRGLSLWIPKSSMSEAWSAFRTPLRSRTLRKFVSDLSLMWIR